MPNSRILNVANVSFNAIREIKILAKISEFKVTHLSRMTTTTLINWTSPIPLSLLVGGILHFYSYLNITVCKQKVETLIRRPFLRRLILVCNVCICPTRTLGGLLK